MAEKIISSEKIKHLEFIQDVIKRMNLNSFYIKGWSITLVSAILVISKTDSISYLFPYLGIPIFWGLDAYYLSQEKKFRKLYELVSKNSNQIELFSMRVKDINYYEISWFKCLYSITIIPVYLTMIIIVLILNFYR